MSYEVIAFGRMPMQYINQNRSVSLASKISPKNFNGYKLEE